MGNVTHIQDLDASGPDEITLCGHKDLRIVDTTVDYASCVLCNGIVKERRDMRRHGVGGYVWVTSKNQAWASEVTGYTPLEIADLYLKAREKGMICSVKVKEMS